MAQGWIPVHRQLQDHWLWEDKPFSKGQAWIDLLLMANHDDNKFLLGNELVEVKAGSFITSELKLMDRWGWGKTKTRAFLDLLQNDGMITKISDRKKTTIIVENYSTYALYETTARPRADHKQTTARPQADTNNNDNNDNNENNENNNIYIGVPDELKQAFKEFANMRKKIKKPITSQNTVTRILNKLDRLAKTTEGKIAILNQSTDRCWQGVFELKDDYKPKGETISGQHETNTGNHGKKFDKLNIPTF